MTPARAQAPESDAATDTPKTLGWQYELGRRPNKVVVVERLDRGGALQLRFRYAGQRHTPFLKAPHPDTIRGTDRQGRPCIDERAESRVQKLVADVRDALLNGTNPWLHIDPPATPAAEPYARGPLSLRALVDAAAPVAPTPDTEGGTLARSTAASRRGVYGANTAEAREFRQLALRGAVALERVLRARGAAVHCVEVRSGDWLEAGRQMLDDFRPTRGNATSGLRSVERALGAVVRCGNWARSAGGIELPTFERPEKGWRRELKLHLERTQARPTARRPAMDRLAPEEAGRLLALVFDPTIALDPRFRLAMVLGFPLRLGQVAHRVWRSCITLGPVGRYGVGQVYVPESGNKPSAGYDLHPDERALIDMVLTGPLRELERAFQRREIPDYPLIPAGRFRAGAVPFGASRGVPRPMSQRRLLELYVQAESWVGIEHVSARSWYGLRRTCTDVGAAVTQDPDVRDMLGGWEIEGTRGSIYRGRSDPLLLANVAEARHKLRERLIALAPTPPMHTVRPKPPLIRRDSPAAQAKYAAEAATRAVRRAARAGRGRTETAD